MAKRSRGVLYFCELLVCHTDIFYYCHGADRSCRGILTTYGAFQEYYQTELLSDQTPSAISWVGSIQATLIPMVGLATGPLVDVGYLRPLIIAGSFLTVFGMMMTSLASSYYQVSCDKTQTDTSLTRIGTACARILCWNGRWHLVYSRARRDFH